MLARLELISFHLALFFAASIVFVFQAGPALSSAGTQAVIVMWLAICGVIVPAISLALRAHDAARWKAARPHGASALILIGHAAPALGGWLFAAMVEAHTGSGVVFLPLMAWAVVFYGIGIIQAARRLVHATAAQPAPSDAGPA